MSTRRCMGRTGRAVTGILGMGTGSVCFASKKARDSGLTLVKYTETGEETKGRLVAASVRRPTVLGAVHCLRRRRNFHIACLPMSTDKEIGLSTLGRTLYPRAVLMSIVCMGGRIKALRPVSRTMGVMGRCGSSVLFRSSTIRKFKGCRVCPGHRGVSLLDTDKRGVRKPGKAKFLCMNRGIGVGPVLFKKKRRGSLHSNARGIPKVTKLKLTAGVVCGSLSVGMTLVHRLGSCFVRRTRGVRGAAIRNLGSRKDTPRVVDLKVTKVQDRILLRALRSGKVCISSKSTYTSGRPTMDNILEDVKTTRRCLSTAVHFDVSRFAAGRRVSCALRALCGYVPVLEGCAHRWLATVRGKRGT